MTSDEIKLADALFASVTFLPGSYDKRFARDICGQATAEPDKELTAKQRACLLQMAHRYRKQLPQWAVKLGRQMHSDDAIANLGALNAPSGSQSGTAGNHVSHLGLPG